MVLKTQRMTCLAARLWQLYPLIVLLQGLCGQPDDHINGNNARIVNAEQIVEVRVELNLNAARLIDCGNPSSPAPVSPAASILPDRLTQNERVTCWKMFLFWTCHDCYQVRTVLGCCVV